MLIPIEINYDQEEATSLTIVLINSINRKTERNEDVKNIYFC